MTSKLLWAAVSNSMNEALRDMKVELQVNLLKFLETLNSVTTFKQLYRIVRDDLPALFEYQKANIILLD